jgi:hypothetical protein
MILFQCQRGVVFVQQVDDALFLGLDHLGLLAPPVDLDEALSQLTNTLIHGSENER